MKKRLLITMLSILIIGFISAQPIIIDHNCTKLGDIPESAINNAKQTLHIAYEHTSHGSQLITGMTALIGQTNLNGYKGDIYHWNEGGTDGALDIDDKFANGSDLGHNGDTAWAQKTRIYLDDPAHSDVNVIIWSWCGGVQDNTTEGIQIYLDKMNELEQTYPNVKFVYMTGHSNIWNDATVKASNKQIRDYCIANNKILYDFYDIERYNPNSTFFEFTNDNCDYYDAAGGTKQGNWATEWQDSHTEGIDWYDCSPAHTKALNGNLKAYAAWWLWCKLAGWNGTVNINQQQAVVFNNIKISPNPVINCLNISFNVNKAGCYTIDIYNITGKKIKHLFNKNLPNGTININWDATNNSGNIVPAGIYTINIKTEKFTKTEKIMVIK
jgi:hypothetical protein